MYAHTDQNLYLVSYMNMINKHCLLITLNVVNTPALEPVELRAELHNLSDCTWGQQAAAAVSYKVKRHTRAHTDTYAEWLSWFLLSAELMAVPG